MEETFIMKASHQGGLSPNKQNKYSIRKYTVGTASLLIGTTLIFGVHAKDASAAEEVAKQTQLAEEKTEDTAEATGESDSDLIPEVPTQDTNQDNAIEDLPEEGATSEKTVNNAEQTQEDETVVEKKQGEDKASSKTQPTPTEKSNENEKAATVDENKEQQATVAERKAVVSQPQETEKSNATNTTPTTTESTPQPKQLAETMKQVTALEDSQEKEAKLVDYYSKNTGVSPEAAKQAVQGMNLDYQNLDSDRLTAEMLIALANKQEKNTPKATPVSLRSPKNLMRAVTLDKSNQQDTRGDRTRNNVNDLITSETKLTVIDSDQNGKIIPSQDYIDFTSKISVDDSVKSGDYFTVQYSDTIQVYGLNPEDIKNIGDIYDKNNGERIAIARHDTSYNTITYTFTDYVDRFNSVKMNLNHSIYIDPTSISENREKVPFEIQVGNTKFSTTADIQYPDYYSEGKNSIGAAFTETVSHVGNIDDPGYYNQVIYVNPLDNDLKGAKLRVQAYHPDPKYTANIGQIKEGITDIKIYKVPDNYKLNKGYVVNVDELTDVSNKYQPVYGEKEKVDINLGDIDSPYVVVVKTKFKPTNDENPVLVQMATLSSLNNRSATKGNALGFTNNGSGGTGEKVYKLGNYVWRDTNKNGIQELGETGVKDIEVVVYENKTNREVGRATTDENGAYLVSDLPNGEYRVEFKNIPEGYIISPSEQGNDRGADSNGLSSVVKIKDEDNLTADLGIYKATYSLGDKVWEDTNKNGIQDDGEKGIGDVKVTLTDKDGKVYETKTDESGNYKFEGLTNGDYTVKFETPSGYEPTGKDQGGNDEKDSDGTEVSVKINGKNDLTIDSGFYKPTYNLGDKVWEDTNKNGIQDDGEKGIGDVKVTLTDKDGKVYETKTDESGNYKFEGLTNGDYTVKFETPSGYEPTGKDQGGNDEKDSDGTEVSVKINGKNDLTIDSGFYKPTYNLGDKVWEDTNKNGIQDEDEKGIKGVKVTLKDSTGEELDTTVTNDKGEYEFKDLPNGEYQVDFETPEGYVPTVANKEDDTKDSDGPLNAKGVIKDEDNLTVDQGFYKKEEPPVQKPATYKVGDKVWHDTNKDGIQNVNEPGISGVTVTLKQPDGTLITTKTDKDGNYIFKDLPNGKYEISFETPEGYEATAEKAGDDRRLDSDGKTVTVEVNNADDLTIDSGFYKKEEPPVQKPATYKVGDKVWHDTNKDGIQNVNEPGISGVTVTLKQPDGTLITTKTDKDGNYIFKDLPNGKYEISFETPEGYEATAEKAGDDRRLDSDGKTVTVEVNNADDLTIDSGFYKKEEPPVQKPATYKVGDKVWHDTNKDGIQNVNEPGISGVTVTLKQPDGTLITTKTDKDGNYIFKDLPNGKYEISFETPEGYEATTENVGDDALDSDGTKVEVEVNNADDLTIDSGFYKPVVEPPKTDATYKVGDKVWNDTNKDGIQNANEAGIEGVKVTLTKADGTTVETRTDKDGNYIFTGLPNGKYEISFETPEGYEATTANVGDDALDSDGTKVEVEVNNADDLTIDSGFYKPVVEPPKTDATYKVGDKVWNDTNKDGIQNANEAGIEGVKVTLTKADGTTVETRTDKDGNYIFTDLPNGKYEISFETPEGYEATTENVGDDALDSDGTKVEVEVNNADDLTIDSGFYKPVVEPPKTDATYKVGDKVWNDTNKDGIQNANEPGIEGVKVTLTKADGTTVETRTDKDGNYIFKDLPNGKYEISFETPEGYEATTENVGDDALDSDGTKVEVEVNNADDLTIDSGFYKPTPEVPAPEVPEQPGNPEVPAPEVPEQPGNPEVPTPEVPEQPGNPEVPTPEVPEQPGNPEVPTPEVPEQPGNPEVPTPEVPEQPGNPEVPTPEVPEQPGNPETPAPNMPEQPGQPKVEKAMPSTPQKAESKHKKETLPETGQENAGQTTLLGSLFAALGGAFLLGRRRKDKKEQ